ncbi:MAG: hypothetical protein AAFW47_04570 [Pseudomonadota bacterium]
MNAIKNIRLNDATLSGTFTVSLERHSTPPPPPSDAPFGGGGSFTPVGTEGV